MLHENVIVVKFLIQNGLSGLPVPVIASEAVMALESI